MSKHDMPAAHWQHQIDQFFEHRDGGLYWKKSGHSIPLGRRWGSLIKDGYRVGQFQNTRFSEHQMVWVLYHAEIVPIDHINGIRDDNRIENLRECLNQSFNCQNKAIQTNNKSGHTGVSWSNDRQKWLAHIQWSGKKKNLGRFDDINEAIAAYAKAKDELHTFHPEVVTRPTVYEAR